VGGKKGNYFVAWKTLRDPFGAVGQRLTAKTDRKLAKMVSWRRVLLTLRITVLYCNVKV
jgi:hypothetical protein